MPKGLIERIENFRYGDRHPSRADAVRVLLEAGLDAKGVAPAPTQTRKR
jgi:hypothetical protein